jgi:pimeloyl-ACP methyl ester carboxylesterase
MSVSHIDTVTVGDITIAYDSVGEGVPSLVLVHGFTGTRADFEAVREPLARNRRVITVDNRGHGDTTHPADPTTYNFSQLVADLAGFLGEVGDGPVHLLGHSMGGMIAMHFALEHPDKLASLVLMDTSAAGPDMPVEFTEEVSEIIFGPVRDHGLDAFRSWSASRENTETDLLIAVKGQAWLDRNENERYAVLDPNVVLAMGPKVFGHESVLDHLRSVVVPTTVIVGSNDAAFVGPSRAIHEAISGSELVVIDGAFHSPQHTHPEQWLAAVEAHMRRID